MAGKLTSEHLDHIYAAAKRATAGPWHYARKHDQAPITGPNYEIGSADRGIASQMHAPDAEFVALCDPFTIRALVSELQFARTTAALRNHEASE